MVSSNLTNLTASPAWYSHYHLSHYPTHHPNNRFLNAAEMAIGAGANDILDYNVQHYHMLYSSNPDWMYDNYNLSALNSQSFSNGMTPPTMLLLGPTLQSHHTTSSNGATAANDHLSNGLQNFRQSQTITVNSTCSEMSSLGMGTNDNDDGGSSGGVSTNSGKTRTKDKYRVVYTDYQRCELEKEFYMAKYITIRRKMELAQVLQLSARQVKVWFQNRRAKDRKLLKKRYGPAFVAGGVAGSWPQSLTSTIALHRPMGMNVLHHSCDGK